MGLGAAEGAPGAPRSCGPTSSWVLPFSDFPAAESPGVGLRKVETQFLAQLEKS